MKLYYLAHPIRPGHSGETVNENIQRAVGYIAALNASGLNVIAPWIGLYKPLRGSLLAEDARPLEVAMEAMRRCDGLILCGLRLSEGMKKAWEEAEEAGLEIIDMVGPAPWAAASRLVIEPEQNEPEQKETADEDL